MLLFLIHAAVYEEVDQHLQRLSKNFCISQDQERVDKLQGSRVEPFCAFDDEAVDCFLGLVSHNGFLFWLNWAMRLEISPSFALRVV